MADDDDHPPENPQRADGSSGEVRARPLSDDPVVEAMGRLKGQEFQAIRDDPKHEQHGAAVEYERLLAERLRPTIEEVTRRFASQSSQLADAVATALEPWQRVSARVVDVGSKVRVPQINVPRRNVLTSKVPRLKLPVFDVPDVVRGDELLARREIVAPKMPELETLRDPTYDVVDGLEETNKRLGALVENVGELVVQAQKDADDARAAAKEAKKTTRWSLIGAWAAVGVSVVLGVGPWLANYVDQREDRAVHQVDEQPAPSLPSTGPWETPAALTPWSTGAPSPARP